MEKNYPQKSQNIFIVNLNKIKNEDDKIKKSNINRHSRFDRNTENFKNIFAILKPLEGSKNY